MPLTIEERHALLESMWELRRANDYPGMVELLSRVSEVELLAEPELGYGLAEGLNYCGEWKRCLALARKLADPCRRRGNDRLFRNRLFLEAHSLMVLGSLSEASRLATSLVHFADEGDDTVLLASATELLGIMADIQCEWAEAIALSQRALALRQRAGFTRGMGAAHHNLGMTYRQLGDYRNADTHFCSAIQLFQVGGAKTDIACSEMERALVMNLSGDHHLAEATARRALRRFTEGGHRAGVGDTNRVLGRIAAAGGRSDAARHHLELALAIVQETGDKLTRAEVFEELAVLEAGQGNSARAALAEKTAAELYCAIGAEKRAERMRKRLQEIGRVRLASTP